ncbi:Asp-tRNA(Asn)/Glu-tRNA(Gln) amidotransferase subunit GatA [Planctomicrobium sp. SH668]|uniref:Asp-tRNA(Asn)/Glu-tRNA(Gln) amidotransferase subunit GatA n=1 Tax=Planctomicrobium sp. SH668 TaxID=3448126 RepID=UPI003F5C6337
MSHISMSAWDQVSAVKSGTASATELVREQLQRIDQIDPQVKAFLSVDHEGALRSAEAIDRKRASGEPLGKLAGLPVAIKDNLCVKGWKTTCASKILENFAPPYDAHIIQRLREEDAVLIGRTNLDEFAMGSTTENSACQSTHNPWNLERVPGGSSGGSAAAVAAGLAPLALGSDTGGSIRQPAAFCGIVGMKPTYGRVSRYGMLAFASSLDQAGPFATNAKDAALLLEAIAGHDKRDSTSANLACPEWTRTIDLPLEGLRIGIVPEHFGEGVDVNVSTAVTQAIDVYRKLGATIVDIAIPHTRYGVAAYYVIAPSEASSNLARYDGVHYGHRASTFSNLVDMYESSRAEGFGDEVKRRIMIGTYALSSGYYDAYYLKAMKVRRLIANDFQAAFQQVDVVLTPTSPTPAYELNRQIKDSLTMYLDDVYTVSANLAGLPGISVPCGFSKDHMPIGFQLIAPAFEEDRLFRASQMFENETDWHAQRPALT